MALVSDVFTVSPFEVNGLLEKNRPPNKALKRNLPFTSSGGFQHACFLIKYRILVSAKIIKVLFLKLKVVNGQIKVYRFWFSIFLGY